MWFRENDKGVFLVLHIQAGSKKTAVAGLHADALKIRLHAIRQKGEANEELFKFLAQWLEIPRKNIELVQGDLSKRKLVFLSGVTGEYLSQKATQTNLF